MLLTSTYLFGKIEAKTKLKAERNQEHIIHTYTQRLPLRCVCVHHLIQLPLRPHHDSENLQTGSIEQFGNLKNKRIKIKMKIEKKN